MTFDFDQIIDRRGTSSIKWEYRSEHGISRHWNDTDPGRGDDQILPMWVADMDFRCPQQVVDALSDHVRHGIYGYTGRSESYLKAAVNWMGQRHGWSVNPEWILTVAGVVPTLNMAVRSFIRPGEKVLIQPPVYHPFYKSIANNGGEIVTNPLILNDSDYEMDFADLEKKASDPAVKLAILCSPHNPVGRIWTEAELRQFGEICQRNGIIVIADEIHGDLIMPGKHFTPYGTLGEAFAQNAIICTAASKTFNLAGLHCSNIMISDPVKRETMAATLRSNGMGGMNPFSLIATEVAYRDGADWLNAALDYIASNAARVATVFAERTPKIKTSPLQGTYLQWFDCRALGLNAEGLEDLMLNKARVYLDEGYIFGPEGEGFERINIACPRAIVDRALDQITAAILGLKTQ
ncbi:pyridoxal phosphate-dependent aminotransferase [Alphaproteobacteria bacterium]|nr:pyridoxal phosphate-dependent aminotransferase [Alphaproteobacteria bacterium]